MQIVDTLRPGGKERVAVNFANSLARRGVPSHICSTRAMGSLESELAPGVGRIDLSRHGLVDFGALKRLVCYIRSNSIGLLHVHGSSLFFSWLAAAFAPLPKLVWHAHAGRHSGKNHGILPYRLALRKAGGVICVNEPLATWARIVLKVPAEQVWYVPNFVVKPARSGAAVELPGKPGQRLVCVANLRPEKNQLELIEAMKLVVRSEPSASLLLVGSEPCPEYAAEVKRRIHQQGLDNSVFRLGSRSDVFAVLQECDVGVLSSSSEGMPLALLEYGMAGLPAVATYVGQVPAMLDEGRAGLLVPPGQAAKLATALLTVLKSATLRDELSREWKRRVLEIYGEASVMCQILRIYQHVLGLSAALPHCELPRPTDDAVIVHR